MNEQFESNYALLVRSEEKGRGVLEMLVYAIFFLSVVSSIWQFAETPLKISAPEVEACVACHTTTTPPLYGADVVRRINAPETKSRHPVRRDG